MLAFAQDATAQTARRGKPNAVVATPLSLAVVETPSPDDSLAESRTAFVGVGRDAKPPDPGLGGAPAVGCMVAGAGVPAMAAAPVRGGGLDGVARNQAHKSDRCDESDEHEKTLHD